MDSASAFFFIATSCFWNPPLLPPTTEDKDRYAFSKLPTQELMIYRRSHVTLAHRAHHDFLTSCQVSPHSATFFSFFCVNLLSRESTQRITIFLTSCHVSPTANRDFFFFFFVFKISCYMCKSLITWVHRAHHDFFNFMSGEPTQRNIFFFFVCKSHITWVHTAHHDSSNLTLHKPTQRLPIHKWPMGLEQTQRVVSDLQLKHT